jgi:PD-(D/E)XK nuclease superfamily
MRTPTYLSPSSISKFYEDRKEFYLKYLADIRPPRFPQTRPMSVGSAFDAYIKHHLVQRLRGTVPPEFEFETIFEMQVEEQNRDWAREAGKFAFEAYERSGAIADLMIDLLAASTEPRFEFTVNENVSMEMRVDAVPLLGKPDIYFVSKNGVHMIFDWKVNGFCSKHGASPKAGYVKIRDGWDHSVRKMSRNCNQAHKDAHLYDEDGVIINVAKPFEEVDTTWADQLSIYAWLMGEAVGAEFVIGIEQLACKPGAPNQPHIRVASHRGCVSPEYQRGLFDRAAQAWKIIQSGHIFDDMSLERSMELQRVLDDYHKAFIVENENDAWFNKVTRGI